MNINDLVALANAGYTKADITALLGAQTPVQIPAPVHAQVQTPVQTPAPVQTPVQIPAPVQTPVQIPAQIPVQTPVQDDSINKMLAEMSLLRQDLQTSNIINSQQPKVETTDDIIAKIINPPIQEVKK